MILGLTPVTSGEIDVFGQNIKGREKRVYPRIGAIIETPGFYPNLTGTENLEIFAKLRGTAAPNAVKMLWILSDSLTGTKSCSANILLE